MIGEKQSCLQMRTSQRRAHLLEELGDQSKGSTSEVGEDLVEDGANADEHHNMNNVQSTKCLNADGQIKLLQVLHQLGEKKSWVKL